MPHCPSTAVFSTVLLGLRAALEKPVGQTAVLHLLQLAVAQTVPARKRTLPAVSKLTFHINYKRLVQIHFCLGPTSILKPQCPSHSSHSSLLLRPWLRTLEHHVSRLQRLSQLQSAEGSVKGPEINHDGFHHIYSDHIYTHGGNTYGDAHMQTHNNTNLSFPLPRQSAETL